MMKILMMMMTLGKEETVWKRKFVSKKETILLEDGTIIKDWTLLKGRIYWYSIEEGTNQKEEEDMLFVTKTIFIEEGINQKKKILFVMKKNFFPKRRRNWSNRRQITFLKKERNKRSCSVIILFYRW